MRQYKFRTWAGKEMITWENLLGFQKEPTLVSLNSNKFVWMQYTGLKDKNGIEIYEGDIVETDHNPNAKPERLRRIVVYHDGSFRTQRSMNSSATDMNNMHSKKVYATNLIVIGNIYQTPELLK